VIIESSDREPMATTQSVDLAQQVGVCAASAPADSKQALSAKPRWYAVQTRAGEERVAEQNLVAQNYTTYLPTRPVTVRHARKLIHKSAAFFPGYLFVQMNPLTDRWRPINGTRGVTSLVMSGGTPLAVPSGVVEALLRLTGPSGELNARLEFGEGQRVRICVGPFSGFEGKVERSVAKERVRVLLAIMSGEISVELRPDHLLPAGGQQ